MIQWLIDQVNWLKSKAQEIISWTWLLYLDTLSKVVYYAFWAKDRAIEWAINALSTVYIFITNTSNWLLANILWYFNEARRYAKNLVDAIVVTVIQVLELTWTMVAPYIVPIRDWLLAKITLAQNWIDTVQADVWKVTDWFKNSLPGLIALVNSIKTLSIDDIKKLILAEINPILVTLREFAIDPVEFIIAIVASKFIAMLTGTLAYGLGTIKYDLPPAPSIIAKQK